MSETPPTPFLMIRPTIFTPAFQNIDGDATLGTSGARAVGTYWIMGRVLTMQIVWNTGTGVTAGASDLLLPLPPGYTAADLDPRAMPGIATEGGFVSESPALCLASVGADPGVPVPVYCAAIVDEENDPPSSQATLALGTLLAGVVAGNALAIEVSVALKELALP